MYITYVHSIAGHLGVQSLKGHLHYMYITIQGVHSVPLARCLLNPFCVPIWIKSYVLVSGTVSQGFPSGGFYKFTIGEEFVTSPIW